MPMPYGKGIQGISTGLMPWKCLPLAPVPAAAPWRAAAWQREISPAVACKAPRRNAFEMPSSCPRAEGNWGHCGSPPPDHAPIPRIAYATPSDNHRASLGSQSSRAVRPATRATPARRHRGRHGHRDAPDHRSRAPALPHRGACGFAGSRSRAHEASRGPEAEGGSCVPRLS